MRIGRRDSDHVAFEVLRRLSPQSTDYWDGNWLVTQVEIRGGGFRGIFEAEIRADEFAGFLEQLERLQKFPRGSAQLKPLEPTILINIVGKGEGRFVAKCEATDRTGGRQLAFAIEFDESELPRIVHELSQIVRDYPVVGKN